MKYVLYTGLSLLLSAAALSPLPFRGNTVHGTITHADCPDLVRRGNGYNKDRTRVMHSADVRATLDHNIIVSFHPLGFVPDLSPTPEAYITQSEQTFLPLILPVTVGSKVHFLNEDEFFHNVQSYTPGARFTIGRRAPGVSYSVRIKKAGVVNLMCDIHSHMSAKILAFDTPYFARAAADGTYSVKNLPDGQYRVEVFHPSCNPITETITVKGGQAHQHDFLLKPRP